MRWNLLDFDCNVLICGIYFIDEIFGSDFVYTTQKECALKIKYSKIIKILRSKKVQNYKIIKI